MRADPPLFHGIATHLGHSGLRSSIYSCEILVDEIKTLSSRQNVFTSTFDLLPLSDLSLNKCLFSSTIDLLQRENHSTSTSANATISDEFVINLLLIIFQLAFGYHPSYLHYVFKLSFHTIIWRLFIFCVTIPRRFSGSLIPLCPIASAVMLPWSILIRLDPSYCFQWRWDIHCFLWW